MKIDRFQLAGHSCQSCDEQPGCNFELRVVTYIGRANNKLSGTTGQGNGYYLTAKLTRRGLQAYQPMKLIGTLAEKPVEDLIGVACPIKFPNGGVVLMIRNLND